MKNPKLFKLFTDFQRQQPGYAGLTTFVDSNWMMSFVIAKQPHFAN